MSKQAFLVEITIPENKCPRTIRDREKLISNGKAKVFLSRNTTANDCMNGIERWGVTSGRNVPVYTEKTFSNDEDKIKSYLDERFGNNWELTLKPVNISN